MRAKLAERSSKRLKVINNSDRKFSLSKRKKINDEFFFFIYRILVFSDLLFYTTFH